MLGVSSRHCKLWCVKDNPQAFRWNESAQYWEKYRDVIRTMFSPITDALIAEAKIVRGNAVLDVGTGPGEPALSVAKFVGPEGKVVGIDPTAEMIEAARRAAARVGLKNVEFKVETTDRMSFAPQTFDAIVSRFAVMFFSDPLGGIRNLLQVLKPGGRMAFAVWSFAEDNPFHYTLSRVIDRYAAPSTPQPESSDAFRFALRGRLLGILNEAGASDTSERVFQFKIEAPLSVEEFWELRSEMSEKLRSKLKALSPEQVAEVRAQIIDSLRTYSTP